MEKIKEVFRPQPCLCLLIARQKMNALRAEADAAVARAEDAEAKNKKYEQDLLEKDQNITSLNHKISVLDGELERAEAKLKELKDAQADGEHSKTTNDGLARKIVLLEEELDAAEKNVKETTEKCVLPNTCYHEICCRSLLRLRQVDVKAEHFERQVQRAEQERDQWEQKYEVIVARPMLVLSHSFSCLSFQEMQVKYRGAQGELDELVKSMEGI